MPNRAFLWHAPSHEERFHNNSVARRRHAEPARGAADSSRISIHWPEVGFLNQLN